jgi:hypothetical protein
MHTAQPGSQRPPNRRRRWTVSLQSEGRSYVATAAYLADGQLAEIFLSSFKVDSATDVGARDAAIACSIALQYDADLETIPAAKPTGRLASLSI